MSQKTASFFDGPIEFIHLALPFIFLGLMIPERLFAWSLYPESLEQRILVDLVFLNVTHNAFTIAMLISMPELRKWVIHQGQGTALRFWVGIILMTLVLALFFHFSHLYLHLTAVKGLLAFVLFFFPVHHALSQSFGLSYLINSTLKDPSLKALELWERRFSLMFLVSITSTFIFIVFQAQGVIELEVNSFKMIRRTLLGLVALSFVLMILLFFGHPRSIRLKKVLYSFRYLVWVVSFMSPIAAAGTRVIHGLEYSFVTHKMMGKSKGRFTWPTLILISLLIVYFGYFRELATTHRESGMRSPYWMLVIASLSVSISYVHYYLDRRMFRMRHAINRETVGELLR